MASYMLVDDIRKICKSLHAVTEDIKWGNDLCFCIGEKMFCVISLIEPSGVSFKVTDGEFDELSNADGFVPAPYVARYKWVLLQDAGKISRKKLEHYIKQSYELIKSKLPKKILNKL